MKIQNKTFVVTGGANGMGRELVLNLLSKGARVAAVDIDNNALQETAALAGNHNDRISTHVVNITNRDEVKLLPGQVIAKHGAVDGVINNAGIIQPFVRINDLDFAAIERVMNINFYGTVNITKAFLPLLMKRPEAHVVNISSMGGFLPVPGQAVYGASKAAVKLFTEALYSELLNTSVRVTVVFPGAMNTNIAAHSGVALSSGPSSGSNQRQFKTLPPGRAAQMIVNGIENNRFSVFVGSDSRYMNLLYRLSPNFATKLIFRQMRSLLPG